MYSSSRFSAMVLLTVFQLIFPDVGACNLLHIGAITMSFSTTFSLDTTFVLPIDSAPLKTRSKIKYGRLYLLGMQHTECFDAGKFRSSASRSQLISVPD